ncbi:unnamed protein product [Schistocephalus solidus]|uniref:Uncharacterized protein n=1 Tax=Schistocephalus solidus TaxID=70667 RepID=A0A183SS61_SCHSO|nr:unnamed protein product [Schistocephalus solidus]
MLTWSVRWTSSDYDSRTVMQTTAPASLTQSSKPVETFTRMWRPSRTQLPAASDKSWVPGRGLASVHIRAQGKSRTLPKWMALCIKETRAHTQMWDDFDGASGVNISLALVRVPERSGAVDETANGSKCQCRCYRWHRD